MSNKFIFARDDLVWDYLRALNCLRGTGDGIRAPVTVTPEPVDEVEDDRYEWKPSREDLKAMWEKLEDGEGDLQSE